MSATRMRLRVVQVQVTVVTAVDDGTDLRVNQNPQSVTIPTLREFQEFATVHLPAALAREEEALNAAPAFPSFPMGSEKQEQIGEPVAVNGAAG